MGKIFVLAMVFTVTLIFGQRPVQAYTVTVINAGDCDCSDGGVAGIEETKDASGNRTYTCSGCGTLVCSGSVIDQDTGNPYGLILYAGDQIAAGNYSGSFTGAESDWGGASATVTWTATCSNHYTITEQPAVQ
ncbi:MAG: hypothetical protein ACRDF4_00950 [Rhabdochlamydiaceae bacterium]